MTLISPRTHSEKSALAPDLRALDERAARAWTERMAVRPLEGGRYAVDAQSGATYVVDLSAGTCTCPDHEIRHQQCKHIRRVAIEITSRRVPPPGKTWAVCDACGTELFVREGAPAPHLCGDCRFDEGEVVRDRETGDRLVVERVTDRRADEVTIESADTTVAEYPTNADYPATDLVVEVSYPGDRSRGKTRTYSFPRSRLEAVEEAALLA